MDTTAWIEIVIIVIALILAATAASAETSLTSISRVRLRQLVEQKAQAAIVIERLHRDPNAYLSTILIVNTVAIIVASSAATLLALHLYHEQVAEWGGLDSQRAQQIIDLVSRIDELPDVGELTRLLRGAHAK